MKQTSKGLDINLYKRETNVRPVPTPPPPPEKKI